MQKKNSAVHHDTQKKGFTLIELLVVIAIISILASILFPVFARARENARRASCMSNVKQLGLAMMQYTQDFDEWLPINGNTPANPSSWDVVIAPYAGVRVRNGQAPMIFRCPSDTGADIQRSYAIPYTGNYGGGTAPFSDANTVFGMDLQATPSLVRGVALAAIPEPAATLLLAEMPSSAPGITSGDPRYVSNAFGSYLHSMVWNPTAYGTFETVQDKARPGNPAHLGGWNYLFADGHVKWLRPEKTLGSAARSTLKAEGNMWVRIKQ